MIFPMITIEFLIPGNLQAPFENVTKIYCRIRFRNANMSPFKISPTSITSTRMTKAPYLPVDDLVHFPCGLL